MKFMLVGKNLSYSLSKRIHRMIYEKLSENHSYENVELNSDDLEAFFSMKRYDGLNITIPYKQSVIKYVDELSDVAKEINSVNTILLKDNKVYGYNTDIIGFKLSCEKFNIDFKDKNVVIMGTGATSKMVEHIANEAEAASIKFVSRTNGDYSYNQVFSGDILINTTPLGTGENDESPVDERVVKNFDVLIDLTYNPYNTKFLRLGIFNNKLVMNGLYMLVAQAVKANELFLNTSISKTVINEIYHELLKDVNFVLIGMMGSGKTTIGKRIAKELDKSFVDLDANIETKTNKTISMLFEHGEAYFREIETSCIKDLSNIKNSIIACGGGVVLNEDNMHMLMKNGIVLRIDRSVKNIVESIDNKSRPLISDDIHKLNDIYNVRKSMYERYAQKTFENNLSEEDISNDILRWYYGKT